MSFLKEHLRKHKRFFGVLKRFRRIFQHPFKRIIGFEEATHLTLAFCKQLPSDFDVVVGIPRSGIFVGSIIAMKFGKPFALPDDFIANKVYFSHNVKFTAPIPHKILVVDDAVASGKQLKEAVEQIKIVYPDIEICTASLFVTPKAKNLVDYYLTSAVRQPFEWLLLTELHMYGELCTDMDGVLCSDCPPEFDDDGPLYLQWIQNAKPYLVPNYVIEAVITSRLEKYRKETETWLMTHGVRFNHLVMLQLDSKTDRTFEVVTRFKAGYIEQFKPFWYWESNSAEAKAIRRLCRSTHILDINTLKVL